MSQVAVFSQLLSRALPPEMQYTMPQQAVHADRQTVYYDAVSTSAGPADTTTLHIPPSEVFLDTHATHLRFKVARKWRVGENTDSAKIYLPANGASALLAGYRIKHGPSGVILEEETNYNLRHAMLHSITVPNHLSQSVLRKLQGTSYVAPDYSAGPPIVYSGDKKNLREIKVTPEYFQIPLKSLLFGNTKHLPLKYLGGLTLELIWATHRQGAIVYDTESLGVPAYEVTDISLVADVVSPSSLQWASFDEAYRQKGLRLYGSTFHHATDSLRSSIQQVRVPFRSASIKTIFVVPRNDARVSDPSGKKDVLHERFPCVEEYQWSIAGKMFPTRPVSNSVEALQELMTAMHGHVQADGFEYWDAEQDDRCKYTIAREMDSSRSLVSGSDEAKSKSQDITLTMKRKSGLTDTYRLDMLVEVDTVLEFRPDGSVAIYK